MQRPHRTVLVIGANGFLGAHIAAALRRNGWRVLRAVRGKGRDLQPDERQCDLQRMLNVRDWLPLLDGVHAVVNAAGILREERGQTFQTIHTSAPLAAAHACVQAGVTRFVQISALGDPEDGEFIASKHAFDSALLALPLDAVVLRPSLVYSVAGSYGGTSLLRAIAGFPGWQWLPGDAHWPVQPVAAEELAALVAAAVDNGANGMYEVGGPVPIALRDYQRAWRHWLRIPGQRSVQVPEAAISLQVWLWERIGSGPVGETMWRMLRRGNVTQPAAHANLARDFGIAPQPLSDVLATYPSQTQDRWHAQLYFLAPALRGCVAILWLLSAWVGWSASAEQIHGLLDGTALQSTHMVTWARAAAALDVVLGVWLLSGWRLRLLIGLMGASVLVYTLAFGIFAPALWRDLLGGLAKNLVVLPALAVLWVLADRR